MNLGPKIVTSSKPVNLFKTVQLLLFFQFIYIPILIKSLYVIIDRRAYYTFWSVVGITWWMNLIYLEMRNSLQLTPYIFMDHIWPKGFILPRSLFSTDCSKVLWCCATRKPISKRVNLHPVSEKTKTKQKLKQKQNKTKKTNKTETKQK